MGVANALLTPFRWLITASLESALDLRSERLEHPAVGWYLRERWISESREVPPSLALYEMSARNDVGICLREVDVHLCWNILVFAECG